MFLVMAVTVELLVLGGVTVTSSSRGVGRQRRSDDAGPLEAVVEHLSQRVTSLDAQLNAATARIATLETKTGETLLQGTRGEWCPCLDGE